MNLNFNIRNDIVSYSPNINLFLKLESELIVTDCYRLSPIVTDCHRLLPIDEWQQNSIHKSGPIYK